MEDVGMNSLNTHRSLSKLQAQLHERVFSPWEQVLFESRFSQSLESSDSFHSLHKKTGKGLGFKMRHTSSASGSGEEDCSPF